MSDLRTTIWNDLLTSEMNVCYWTSMTRRYVKRDQSLKIFLACMASGSVAGWGFWSDCPILWQSLSCLSTLLAIALPILNLEQKIAKMSEMTGKWLNFSGEVQQIWFKLEESDTDGFAVIGESYFSSLKPKLVPIYQEETRLPQDKNLLKRCQRQVCKSRHLNGT